MSASRAGLGSAGVSATRAGLGCVGLVLALACGGEPRGTCDASPAIGELGSVCGFENPEDVAWLPAAQLLLVSQMRHPGGTTGGSLAALPLGPQGEPLATPRVLWPPAQTDLASAPPAPLAGDPACAQPPPAASFAPHGLASAAPAPDGSIAVAVVAHGEREAVELFQLRGSGAAASLAWTGCVALAPGDTGNDVWLDARGDLWVTNYQPATSGMRGLFYTIVGGLGLPTGEVLRWRAPAAGGAQEAAPGWEVVADTRGANPNGIALDPGGSTLAVAFTGSRSVAIRPLTAAGARARDVDVGGHPDNLLWSARGTLLAAVHTSGFQVLECRFGALPCRAPWQLLEIDLASGAVSERFAHDGSRLGAVASVAEVGDRLYLGAIFDDRIGVLRRH